MKQQFVITLTVRQTEIPSFETAWLQTHLLWTCCVHKIYYFSLYFRKNI